MNKIKNFFEIPGAYLLLSFLIINIVCGQHGGNNTNSRFSLLRMMSQKGTFQINPIIEQKDTFWTDDWSRTPDKNYYSNKAPGSAFLALPIFAPLDYLSKLTWNKQKSWFNTVPSRTTRKLTSIILQAGLFIFLFVYLYRRNQLAEELKHPFSLISFLILFCFANTSSNYMNTLFGHGLAAVLTFWFVNSLRIKNYFHLGLSFGFGLLNDYSFALFIFAAIGTLLYDNQGKLQSLKNFVFGGIPAGFLWVWYHWLSFGSPLTIANKFQNPKYVDVQSQENIMGIFSTTIDWTIYKELLWGLKRGILITQPWVLLAFFIIFFAIVSKVKSKNDQLFLAFNLITFLLLLIMNTSFGGWHGGHTIGPRYLSIIFPWFALSIAYLLKNDFLNMITKIILGISVLWSVGFYTLVSATTILSFRKNLLLDLTQLLMRDSSSKGLIRILVCSILIIGALILEKRRLTSRQDKLPQ